MLGASLNALFSFWFADRGLTFVISMNIVFGRLGSILAGIILPRAYEAEKSLYLPLLIGLIICLYSLGCSFIVIYFDKKANSLKHKIDN